MTSRRFIAGEQLRPAQGNRRDEDMQQGLMLSSCLATLGCEPDRLDDRIIEGHHRDGVVVHDPATAPPARFTLDEISAGSGAARSRREFGAAKQESLREAGGLTKQRWFGMRYSARLSRSPGGRTSA